jgi:6-phosphogluconolactonase
VEELRLSRPREVRRLADAEAVAGEAAATIAARMREAVAQRGAFHLVLAGGSTPRRAYELLAAEAGLPWSAVSLYWGDERCVAPDHPDSNFGAAKAALLDRVGVEPANVHRMRAEQGARVGSDLYEHELRRVFGRREAPGFDLVLLGMGEDGHTASLFPGAPTLRETARWVIDVHDAPKPPAERVTLTLPALCAAREALVLVCGAGKREALGRILTEPGAERRLPAAAVHARERTVWLADEAALGVRGGGTAA